MAKNLSFCTCDVILCVFIIFACLVCCSDSVGELGLYNTFTISSFRYPKTRIRPFELRYIRVELPPWFSSMSFVLESDVDLDIESIEKVPKSAQMICFRDGSPPLPDVSNTSLEGLALGSLANISFGGTQGLQNVELCYPMQETITLKLTNEQISPGIWYFGLFNGIGATRTQGKMISRGSSYSFSVNITVEGCSASSMWGQYCNQTVDQLSCSQSDSYNSTENIIDAVLYNQTFEQLISCRDSFETSCHQNGEAKFYSFEVMGISEQLTILARDMRFNVTPSSNDTNLMCFARHGAMPSSTLYDYSGDINKGPLVILFPKVGRWSFTVMPVNISKDGKSIQGNNNPEVCYSMEWKVLQCPLGRAGPNCTWERFMLQTILRATAPFESYYLPASGEIPSNSANFPLKPLSSNYSNGVELDQTWIYFLMDIPRGAAGGNIHIRLTSDAKIKYEIYARHGGLPSLDSWDYYYANSSRNSNGANFFMLSNSTEEKIDFYILYVKEGIWSFGLRHLNSSGNTSQVETAMSISLERCPKRCSSHGQCKSSFDASGLASYSYCSCDRNHGGFDCSIEIVSHQGHIWQSIMLIASNAAALLPAFWALRQKAFPEWVLFTSSGISSGLYHACDVGTWCALSFRVLQFMDFWLSFMAVVSTFVYLATIDEVFKRTIHTAVAILTALMAATGATRSANISLVLGIGALGLLVGWLIEFATKFRSFSFSAGFCLNMLDRWETTKQWIHNLIKTLLRRFRWGFILAGSTALAMAAISWKLETSESYWIWHSVWHVTIYTSSFFFLCSKVLTVDGGNQTLPDANYELTRQDSFSRGS